MKNYRVIVNGVEYEIAIEQVEKGQMAPPPAPNAPPPPKAQPQAAQGGEEVKAPMPGTILSVNVKQGDTVQKGQVLLILEAMKMENEILSPRDGVVTSLAAQAGQTVETGALLCVLA